MIKDKIKDAGVLKGILASLKNKGKKIVFTNGCFDILHVGHVSYLEETKALGDILVVAINSDASVKKIKGKGRPLTKERDREEVVAALASVDFVTLFCEDTPESIVKELDPDVIVKGGDWKEGDIVGGDYVKKRGGKVVSIPFRKGYSTTSLIKRVKGLQ
ncbi:MAG: D-glycero-beta-D-manno-heptose 1-phosphate adenylyltransferase [Candidatus Omnitrophica bacterium]|nr:D-glycero-beta-D-manno-heptose 1-phosphate adenylyltransferase [Candidatus Omnitrophota bacterium]